MIYLKKGQPLFENGGLVVYDQAGYYEDGDLVVCAMVDTPEEPYCRYEAKYVAYGGIVYSITDTAKLEEEIAKINPENLFGKSSDDVITDQMVENIETVKSEDPPIVEEEKPVEIQEIKEEEQAPAIVVPEEDVIIKNSSSTPDVSSSTATSTKNEITE